MDKKMLENVELYETIIKKYRKGQEVSKEELLQLQTDQSKHNIETAAHSSAMYKMLLDKGIFTSDDLDKFEKYKQEYLNYYLDKAVEKTKQEILDMLKEADNLGLLSFMDMFGNNNIKD